MNFSQINGLKQGFFGHESGSADFGANFVKCYQYWNISIKIWGQASKWVMESNSWNSTKPYVGLDLTLTPPLSFPKFISLENLWEGELLLISKGHQMHPFSSNFTLSPPLLGKGKEKNRMRASTYTQSLNQSHKCHLLNTSTWLFRWLPTLQSNIQWGWCEYDKGGGDSGYTLAGNH